ncbi:MAG: RES family NAD+ phosphorylase [Deltaproteobacteria bacterium]|nr:RES family NAD+ phosphorylase [Deltaproteobacteria bacterium]
MNLLGCLALSRSPETGTWYRAIQPQFWQTSLTTTQTKVLPSRFNEGNVARPQFEVLYLAETQMVVMFEVQALFGSPTQPGGVIANPRRSWTVINVQVQLQDVADLTQVSQQTLLATTAQELTGDWYGYQQRSALTSVTHPVGTAPTQALGAALFAVSGLEGFLTLSARLPYHKNLLVFPQKLRPGSSIVFHDPATGQQYMIAPPPP